ncbi:hypothetical protein [Nitrosomonas sp.]|uniref:hypothetical protein n=1 Tax=Nitrosomonas sp. TaxID=42353 RepID=UPI001DF4BFBA|nr:hypothetical protein [Nitrosomonas sp.]MBX3616997.1 hypothetical protein [Nitrosomonas sp.]
MSKILSTGIKKDRSSADETRLDDTECILRNTEADEFFINIKGELNQVDRLVSDAVNNLVINFKFISKLTKSHHDMVLAIEKLAAPEGSNPILDLLEKQMVVADKIEQELEMAITSLQFGDLVTQLLAHTSNQVEMLNIELQRIDRQSSWRGGSSKKTLNRIHEEISEAVALTKNNSKRKPVVQQGMQMGDIELF